MPLTDVHKDLDALTMTITAELDVPVERAWQLFADPRQLERWWGPPTYPATVHAHDLVPGGRVHYSMTGPEGDTHHGYWDVLTVDAPYGFQIEDGFADESAVPDDDLPSSRMTVRLDPRDGGGTRMSIISTFATAESMAEMLQMGVEEGFKAALGQIDEVLAASR